MVEQPSHPPIHAADSPKAALSTMLLLQAGLVAALEERLYRWEGGRRLEGAGYSFSASQRVHARGLKRSHMASPILHACMLHASLRLLPPPPAPPTAATTRR